MSAYSEMLFNEAELALAAYADLDVSKSTTVQIKALTDAGMSAKEAAVFANRYPDVVAVADYPDSGFQATVFRDAGTGKLTVAMRGTLGAVDLLGADFGEITPYGAAYSQIVDMYNWWVRVSSPAGQPVQQYGFVSSTTRPENALVKLSSTPAEHGGPSTDKYLVLLDGTVSATGECFGASVDVTGHSLGGHLAGAFAALFSDDGQVNHVTTFNAPGFKDTATNQQFFAALGGVMPFAVSGLVTRVRGNEALPGASMGDVISGLNSPVGQEVQLPIENQYPSGGEPNPEAARNHSQTILTDSAAVFNLLGTLDSSLTTSSYYNIFQSASNEAYKSLESIVDGLQAIFNIDHTDLPAGNNQRDELYKAIYALQANDDYNALIGNASVASSNNRGQSHIF